MYKIWKYFEKGQVLVCDNHVQLGLDTIRFIRLSNNLMNFSNPSYFAVTIISNIFSNCLKIFFELDEVMTKHFSFAFPFPFLASVATPVCYV